MLKNWKNALAALALSIATFAAGAAFTASAHAAPWYPQTVALRGEYGSAHNILSVKSRLENLIDQLQRDQRDYDGHRVAAINLMQQARGQLQAAINYDAEHAQ